MPGNPKETLAEEAAGLIDDAQMFQIMVETADYTAPIEYAPEGFSQNKLPQLLREALQEDEDIDLSTGEIVQIEEEKKNLPAELSDEDKKIEHDFDKAQKNADALMGTAKTAIGDLLALGRASDSPDVYQALNGLLKTANEINTNAFDLHVKKKKAKSINGGETPAVNAQQNIQQNFYTGSTAELAMMLKDARKPLK